MKQLAMVIDLQKCLGCHTCAVTCKAEWQVPHSNSRCVVHEIGPDQTRYGLAMTFYVGMCGHCDNPLCVDVCPVTPELKSFTSENTWQVSMQRVAATWKNPFNGLVEIDQHRCIGCGKCVHACPYNSRYLKSVGDGLFVADKCTFCYERLVVGDKPACVKNCLADAMFIGDINDTSSEVYAYLQKGALRLDPFGKNTDANVYYHGSKRDISLLKAGYEQMIKDKK